MHPETLIFKISLSSVSSEILFTYHIKKYWTQVAIKPPVNGPNIGTQA